jgi:hypothetical protein
MTFIAHSQNIQLLNFYVRTLEATSQTQEDKSPDAENEDTINTIHSRDT